MSRRRRAVKRKITPDPRFGSIELSRFINKVMLGGKRTTAQRIVYQALDRIEDEAHRPGLEVFQHAIRNAMPQVQVKSRRVGGTTYQVPTDIGASQQTTLAMRWIISSARGKYGRPMSEFLAQEFLEASRGQGNAVKRKEDLHRMADANRAFAHYKW